MKKCNTCKAKKDLSCFSINKARKDGLDSKCKSCRKSYRDKRKDKYIAYQKEYRKNNKEKVTEYNLKYVKENKGKITLYNREYMKKYSKNRRKNDPLFKLKNNLRKRIWFFFKNNKNKNTEELLGCTFEEAKTHIESTFTEGMTWENYGEWHVDHIIPLASVEIEKELIELCHYTNLQALWAFDNLSKGAKINF